MYRLRTFEVTRLVLDSGGDVQKYEPARNQLIVTHASNKECLRAIIDAHRNCKAQSQGTEDLRGGLILLSDEDPDRSIAQDLEECEIPTVWVKKGGFGPLPTNKTDPFKRPASIDTKVETR